MFLYLREREVFLINGEEVELCHDVVRGESFSCVMVVGWGGGRVDP